MHVLFFHVKCRRPGGQAVEPQLVRVEADDEASARQKIESLGLEVESVSLEEVREAGPFAAGVDRLRAWCEARLGPGYARHAVPAASVLLGLLVLWAILD